jgi:hypothetical protein
VAQVIGSLPSKHEALSSNPNIAKKKKKGKKKLGMNMYACTFFWTIMYFELRASCLLGNSSITESKDIETFSIQLDHF